MKGILYLPEGTGGVIDQLKNLIEVLIPGEKLEVVRSSLTPFREGSDNRLTSWMS